MGFIQIILIFNIFFTVKIMFKSVRKLSDSLVCPTFLLVKSKAFYAFYFYKSGRNYNTQ